MSTSQPEAAILSAVRLALSREIPTGRLFRNHAGIFWAGRAVGRKGRTVMLDDAQQVMAGLHIGAADLIGATPIIVTPELVGRQLAVLTSIEVKTPSGRVTPEQENWAVQVRSWGGIAGIVRSPDEAIALIKSAMRGVGR